MISDNPNTSAINENEADAETGLAENTSAPVGGDAVIGAKAIGRFVFGKDDPSTVRKVYHKAANNQLPVWRVGGMLMSTERELGRFLRRDTSEEAPAAGEIAASKLIAALASFANIHPKTAELALEKLCAIGSGQFEAARTLTGPAE